MTVGALIAACIGCMAVGLAVSVVATGCGVSKEVAGRATGFLAMVGCAFFLFRFAGVL